MNSTNDLPRSGTTTCVRKVSPKPSHSRRPHAPNPLSVHGADTRQRDRSTHPRSTTARKELVTMNTAITNNVPRELPIAMLTESPTNPRRVFDEAFLKELASSIDSQGVLASLLVRPKNQGYEIVFGAQRFRAAQIAGKEIVP